MSCTTMSVFTEECGVSYIDTNATVAGIEVLRYKGAYTSFEELINAHPIAEPGDYAVVVEPDKVLLYIWAEDSWTLPINKLMSPEEVKTLYEENENTNAFTDANLVKLNSIEAGAQVNSVTSVAGKVGSVTLNKADVGLNNVDNTSDLNKPISTATQTALNAKVDKVAGQSLMLDSERTKLSGIEEGAQVNVATNLAQSTRTATTVLITSSTGTNATLSAATTTQAGVMASADKSKLDGIAAGAQVNTVTSVAGKTGTVVLDKTDVGLGSVDNTSDLNKPISNATQAALNLKLNVNGDGSGLTNVNASTLGGQLPAYYATASQVGDISTALDLINGEGI